MKPLKMARLDQIEESLYRSSQPVDTKAIFIHPDIREGNQSYWIMASDLASMVNEIRRRRRKMNYQEKS